MQQAVTAVGAQQTLTVRTSNPTADGQGLAMAWAQDTLRYTGTFHKRYRVRVTVSGAATPQVKLQLWIKDSVITSGSGAWGVPYDASGNNGQLGNGAILGAGVYFFVLEDVGPCAEICLVSTTVQGTPTVAAVIAALVEKQEMH